MNKKFAVPRGTSDILPEITPLWEALEFLARKICKSYGYKEIRTPIYEDANLFKRSLGATTDVVNKQLLEISPIASLGKIPYLHEWSGSILPVLPKPVEHTWFQAMTMMDLLPHITPPSSNDDDETSRHDYDRILFLPLMRHCKPLKELSTPLQRNPRAKLFRSCVMHVMARLLFWATVVGTVAAVVWYSYELKNNG